MLQLSGGYGGAPHPGPLVRGQSTQLGSVPHGKGFQGLAPEGPAPMEGRISCRKHLISHSFIVSESLPFGPTIEFHFTVLGSTLGVASAGIRRMLPDPSLSRIVGREWHDANSFFLRNDKQQPSTKSCHEITCRGWGDEIREMDVSEWPEIIR
jgi:hypothetical protein